MYTCTSVVSAAAIGYSISYGKQVFPSFWGFVSIQKIVSLLMTDIITAFTIFVKVNDKVCVCDYPYKPVRFLHTIAGLYFPFVLVIQS